MRPIERIPAETPFDAFFARYSVPNVPVIITDVGAAWPAATKWTREYLPGEIRHRARCG